MASKSSKSSKEHDSLHDHPALEYCWCMCERCWKQWWMNTRNGQVLVGTSICPNSAASYRMGYGHR